MGPATRHGVVLASGLVTTAITAWLLYDHGAGAARTYSMGVPMGALGLGLLAGSGYGVASYKLTDLVFRRSTLLVAAITVAATYGVFQWAEYQNSYLSYRLDFLGYLAESAEHSSTHTQYGSTDAHGWFGYGYYGLELVGMLAGSVGGMLIVPGLRNRLGLH